DPAERQDHRCAPPPARLLLRQLQAAVRGRAGVHLRSRGDGALLPRLRRAHGPLGPGAAGTHPARALRARGCRPGRTDEADPRVSRPALRGNVPRISPYAAVGSDTELRAGPASDLPRCRLPMAALRALPGRSLDPSRGPRCLLSGAIARWRVTDR